MHPSGIEDENGTLVIRTAMPKTERDDSEAQEEIRLIGRGRISSS